MSHLVTSEADIRDALALRFACRRLSILECFDELIEVFLFFRFTLHTFTPRSNSLGVCRFVEQNSRTHRRGQVNFLHVLALRSRWFCFDHRIEQRFRVLAQLVAIE